MDYFGTLRGRVGYATDSTLAYATGGFAYGTENIVAPQRLTLAAAVREPLRF